MKTLFAAAVFFAILQHPAGCSAADNVAAAGGGATGARESAGASTLSGLVGYWSFDEGQGDTAANIMGVNGDLFSSRGIGSAVMAGAAWAEGKFGKAVRFERKDGARCAHLVTLIFPT